MSGVIYGIRFKDTERIFYVGQTCQAPHRRWRQHMNASTPVGRALQLFGDRKCFDFIILERVEDDNLDAREVYWIAKLNSLHPHGLNQNPGGHAGNAAPSARRMSSERMKRITATPEFKEKVSPIRKALWADPGYREKTIEAAKAAKATPEHKAKLSVVKLAMWGRPGHRENIAVKTAKQWADPEKKAAMRAAISAAKKAQFADPVRRAQIIARRNATLARKKVEALFA